MSDKKQTIGRRDGEKIRVTGPAEITVRILPEHVGKRVELEIVLEETRVERVKSVDAAPPVAS